MSALPEIAYDVYPEPQHVTPREEPVFIPAPVFIEPAPYFAPPVVERIAPPVVERFVPPAPVVERVAPDPFVAPGPFVAPSFGSAPVFGPAPVFNPAPAFAPRAPVTTVAPKAGAWPAPKSSVQQSTPAKQTTTN